MLTGIACFCYIWYREVTEAMVAISQAVQAPLLLFEISLHVRSPWFTVHIVRRHSRNSTSDRNAFWTK